MRRRPRADGSGSTSKRTDANDGAPSADTGRSSTPTVPADSPADVPAAGTPASPWHLDWGGGVPVHEPLVPSVTGLVVRIVAVLLAQAWAV